MDFKTLSRSILLIILLAPSALADEVRKPIFDYQTELYLSLTYKNRAGNKAYAMGLGSFGSTSWDMPTLAAAEAEAMEACQGHVRRQLGPVEDTACQLVLENDKFVWPGPLPEPLDKDYLPRPDRPLMAAHITGDLANAKALLLMVHGCDGQNDPTAQWYSHWVTSFQERDLAVIEPDSFADPHPVVCASQPKPIDFFDAVYRLRTAQTLRTLSILRRRFPSKPIFLWGHSEGGNIVQLADYHVDGVIITGADCHWVAAALRTPTLHIFGGRDPYTLPTLTEEDMKENCSALPQSDATHYVLVPSAGHFVNVTEPAVSQGLDWLLHSQEPVIAAGNH